MRRNWLIWLLVFSIWGTVAWPASADGIIIPRPPRPVDPPFLLRSLTIKEHHVRVTIDSQVATTRVDQTFVNETGREIEGEYIFPLPEGAAIHRFAMWVDGRPLDAELMDRDSARRIYEEIVRQRRDPALLEYVGRGAFRARIYPIPAHGEKRVELEYSEVLTQDQGLVRYSYPLNTEKFSARPLQQVSVTIRIKSTQPLKGIYSPSHAVRVQKNGEFEAEARYSESQVLPDRDMVLYYQLGPDDVGASLLSYRQGDEDGFFLLLLGPKTEVSRQDIVAKDVLFVLDTSGSMRGEKLTQAKAAALYVLDNLNPQDRFNIVAFSNGTRTYSETLRPAREAGRARSFVQSLSAGGGTNIDAALREALDHEQSERPQIVIFLTDGQPTVGETDTDRIIGSADRRASHSVRIFSFGVGYDVNTLLLDALSQAHHGVSAYVRPGEDIEQSVSSFYEKISMPILADPVLHWGSWRVYDTFPQPLPDLYAGGQLVLVGRYRRGGVGTLTLTGTVNGEKESYTYRGLHLVDQGGADFIPRLWATRKIGALLTQIRLNGPDRVGAERTPNSMIDEIVELSVRYGIVTPYTSFLVDETEDALTQEGRRTLGAKEIAKSAPPSPKDQGVRGSGPMAAPASGAVAVEKSIAQEALRQADVAASAQHVEVRTVGDKTFVLRDGVWTDTQYEPGKTRPEQVALAGERYLALLQTNPQWGRYLALGTRLILVWEGRAYHFTD